MELFVARQPILDASLRVIGYELLLHAPGIAGVPQPQSAAAVAEKLLSVGLDTLVGDRLAFVHVDEPDVLDDFAGLLPPGCVVLEIDATVVADPARIEQWRGLRRQGYALAVDRFSYDGGPVELITEFDFVKVVMNGLHPTGTGGGSSPHSGGPAFVALGVDTPDDLAAATAAGFTLFQGRYFGRASSRRVQARPAPEWERLGTLAAVSQPGASIFELEEVVKADAGLCLRVLRAANSPACAVRSRVQSIRQALVLLGRDVVRHWLALWVVHGLGRDAHAELLTTAVVRAHCCDALAATIGEEGGFIVGLCSTLDQVLMLPMDEVLQHVPLTPAATAALLGEPNDFRHLLDAVVAYERGDWNRCHAEAASIGADVSVIPKAYTAALRWQALAKTA